MIIFWALFCHLAVLNSVPLDKKSHCFVLHFVLDSLSDIGLYDIYQFAQVLFDILKSSWERMPPNPLKGILVHTSICNGSKPKVRVSSSVFPPKHLSVYV